MPFIAYSASRSGSQEDLHPFERLAVRLSSCFRSVQGDDAAEMVSRALEEIGATFGVDECTLISYDEGGAVAVVRSWAAHSYAPCTDEDVTEMPWLVQRLARNTVVTVTPTAELPRAATRDRAQADRSGVVARLAVPVVVGSRVVYGLLIGSRQRSTQWRVPVIERLQLLGEILGGGLSRLKTAEPVPGIAAENAPPPESRSSTETPPIIGESESLRLSLTRLERVAPLDATILLLGETGTGKELFARAAHDLSRRRTKKLVRLNCAALPASLIESELFGHERGAFTGAVATRQGRFELADGGTIFLDEIGDLPLELQAKLLRVLQEGEFERVGSSATRRVDVRVITATHVDLETAVADGRFRADLFYRLSVFPITLPPLRDRREDIPSLVHFFIQRYQRDLSRKITCVPDSVMETLQAHVWPGNIRELENVIARAMIRSADGILQLDDQLHVGPRTTVVEAVPRVAETGETLDAVQRRHIERVLRECGWRINGVGNAAVRLGLHPNTLRFRIKKLGVEIPRKRGPGVPVPAVARPA